MAKFIALDWDHHQLHLVEGNVGRGSAQVNKAVMFNEDREPFLGNAEELGQRLKERLKESGVKPAPVLACIGRDRLILKEIRHPQVPKNQEPSVVRFQVTKDLTDNVDDVIIDYIPLPGHGDSQRALGIIVRRDLVETYQNLCKAAGLKLAGLTLRPLALSSCLKEVVSQSPLAAVPEAAGGVVALVTLGEKWAELIIARGDVVLLTRTLNNGPGLAGEIKRNLALHSAHAPKDPVTALYLALGGDNPALRGKLENLLDIPVRPFDPFAGAEKPELPDRARGSFAGAVGLLHLQSQYPKGLPANFLKPKEAKPEENESRRAVLLCILLFIVVAGGLLVIGRKKLKEKEKELTGLRLSVSMLDQQKLKLQRDARELEMLSEWDNVPWLDEVYDLAHRIPTISDSFRVMKLEGSTIAPQTSRRRRNSSRDEYAAVFRLEGYAPDNKPVDELVRSFQRDLNKKGAGYYRPTTPKITQQRFRRTKQFSVTIGIKKRSPEEYQRSFNQKEDDKLEDFFRDF